MANENNFGKLCRNYQTLSPAEIKLDKEHIKFVELISELGISNNLINIFDNWIFGGILEKQISYKTFKLQYGTITFTDVIVHKPTYEVKDKPKMLTPKIARENNYTYSGNLEVTITFTPLDTNYPIQSKKLKLGLIPIMLGSKCCHLNNKTTEELIKLGECPNDPLGYFIIKGTEKIINIQEKIRTSQIFTFKDKEGFISQLTCVVPIGTSKMAVFLNKNNIYEISFGTLLKKNLEIFMLFDILLYEILENNTLDNIIEYSMNLIMKYIDEKYKIQSKYKFNVSMLSVKKHFDEKYRFYKHIMKTREMGELLENQMFSENKTTENNIIENSKIIPIEIEKSVNTIKYTFEDLKIRLDEDILGKELFPHIFDKDFKLHKANLLAYMIAHNCQCQLGKEPDNKDNWMNKRLVTSGNNMEIVFNDFWNTFVLNEKAKNINNNFTNTTANFNTIFISSIITEKFVSTFAPNNWGSKKNSAYNENITDNMKRETSMSVISQIGRINTPRNSRTKDISIRSLQNTQLGYICCSETPEGEKCGLAKNIALTTTISLERSISSFEFYISELIADSKISADKTEKNIHLIMGNCKIYGWCDKNIVLPFLKQKKRDGFLPFDACIYFNIYNKVLEYNCDSSRLLRPLLTINLETENLIIDEKMLWDSSISDIYKYGGLELIDSREQDDITVALNIESYKNLLKTKKEIYLKKDNLEKNRKYNNVEYEYFKIFYSHDEMLQDIIVDLNNNKDKYIRDVITLFDYNYKLLLGKFSDFSIKDFLKLFDLYTSTKATMDSIIEEFKVDDVISDLSNEIYTHCEFDPISIFGIASSLIPKSDSNQGPRTVYQASMCKQALGPYHFNKHLRFDTAFKALDNPQRPIFEAFLCEVYGLNIMPTGQNPIVAYLALDANNEDAIVCKQEYIDSGFCDYTKYITIKYICENSKAEYIKYPNLSEKIDIDKYKALKPNGLPKIGAIIKRGDCIIGKVIRNSITGQEENNCLFAHIGEEGTIDRILITKHSDGNTILRIKLRKKRKLQCGDKLASRYSQKGTVGKILPACQLPRIKSGVNEGLIPDFFINPNSSISRMTQGKFKEFLMSKAALYNNSKINATSFQSSDLKPLYNILEQNGDIYGDEIMEHPNGLELRCKVFIAPCNYQCLKHHVDDKIQMRGTFGCEYDEITRQPIKGRTREGGLRCGEMERDAFISHGSSSILLDRMMTCSDKFVTAFCMTCGTMAITNIKGKFSSCNNCGKDAKIGSVTLCYIFKLIINFLNAIGISVKLKLKNTSDVNGKYEERFLT